MTEGKSGFGMIQCSSTLPDPCSLEIFHFQNAVIVNFKQDQGWSIAPKRNLNDWKFKDYMQLILLLKKTFPEQSLPSCIFWKRHSKGHFSIKSCLNTLAVSTIGLVPWPEKQFGIAISLTRPNIPLGFVSIKPYFNDDNID